MIVLGKSYKKRRSCFLRVYTFLYIDLESGTKLSRAIRSQI